ncbi:MAG: hypothetical protein ACJ75G_01810 [Gaiellaceae bacterium]
MRKTVAVLAVCSAAAGIVPAVAQPRVHVRPAPSLRLAARSPLTVAGRNFRPRERLRVTATVASRTRTVAVHAGTAGRFKVTFLRLAATRCDLLRVVAVRRSGALVVLKSLPAPACSAA